MGIGKLILDCLKVLVGAKYINTVDELKDFIQGILSLLLFSSIVIPIALSYIIISDFKSLLDSHGPDISIWQLKDHIHWFYATVMLVIFILVCLIIVFAILKISHAVVVSDFHNQLMDQYTAMNRKLIILQDCFYGNSHISYNLIRDSIGKANTSFLSDLRNAGGTTAELVKIAKKFNDSDNDDFLAVIASQDFFKSESTSEAAIAKGRTEYMIKYFLQFDNSDKTNSIRRIFTIPGKNEDGNFFTNFDRNQNLVLLKYLIINEICSIDTYLLVYNDQKPCTRYRFFTQADYVLYFSRQKNASLLYFAFPEEGQHRYSTTILEITDKYLISIFENDFYYRMNSLSERGVEVDSYATRFGRNKFNQVLKVLNLDKGSDKVDINIALDHINNVINNSESKNKEDLIYQLKNWRIKAKY